MLKAYYAELSDPILEHYGEIYQYVGDEIVISWKVKNKKHNFNCILCFFAIKKAIASKAKHFEEKFGLVPQFKASLHVGAVTTGEIGIIKKEIIFTGDVLNTAARIQELCNHFKVDILLSAELLQQIDFNSEYHLEKKGTEELRGRNKSTEVFTVTLAKHKS